MRERRLIVNADDFGRSSSINEAIRSAHREGVLTTASLMVAGEAFPEAVAMARELPTLGVGLHLSLVCGRSVLSPAEIPGLVDSQGHFDENPFRAGFRYFASRPLKEELRREIRAQFERFRSTGLVMDHLNGHLHLHLHPVVLDLWMEEAAAAGVRAVRWTHDPLALNLRIASGSWPYRVSHALAFRLLSGRARHRFRRAGYRHADHCFGLLQNGRVNEAFVLALLDQLPPGDSELYSHPSLHEFRDEYDALVSPQVRSRLDALKIRRIRYQDLRV